MLGRCGPLLSKNPNHQRLARRPTIFGLPCRAWQATISSNGRTVSGIEKADPPDADDGHDTTDAASTDQPVEGLLERQAKLETSIKRRVALINGRAAKLRRLQEEANGVDSSQDLPPRVAATASSPHHDLASFLDYAAKAKLKKSTTVYKGTLYEYAVAEALKAYDFSLSRVGRANDLGIDLIGHWTLPGAPYKLRVLIQCKMGKPMPSLMRELEGAYSGAPAGWQGEDVLALLVSAREASPGARQAMQRSKWPIGILQATVDGHVKQFLWNAAAAERGLAGVGVTVKYGGTKSDSDEEGDGIIALTWLGGKWPSQAGR